jgi:signal transduction histidine kinase
MGLSHIRNNQSEMERVANPVDGAMGVSGIYSRRLFETAQRKQAEKSRLMLESQAKEVQKMTAIASLAGGIAHQFNNALAVIAIGLDMLEEDEIHQATDGYLQPMKSAANQMSRLIRQLLAFAGGVHRKSETMSLSELVEASLPLLSSFLKPPIAIETELPSDLPKIYADRNQMQMALVEVLTNASEAIETQGLIRIICRKEVVTAERVKAFAGLVPGIYVSLTVADNGKGMNEETRSRVFDPFFTTNFLGRGLGMAAVYGIVKSHDGRISIESQADQGTVVRIYLPVVDSMCD